MYDIIIGVRIENMKKTIFTLDKIKAGFDSFYKEYGHYPTATEIDSYAKLPSSRQIQRVFGGLPKLRALLKIDAQIDLTEGLHSSNRAKLIHKKASMIKKEVSTYLIDTFGERFVHPEFFFNDDKRTRTDFYVQHSTGTFAVDIFNPKDLANMNKCLNSKLKTYRGIETKYLTIFLMMNHDIDEGRIERMMENKKNKLRTNQAVMTFKQFKAFCKAKSRARA